MCVCSCVRACVYVRGEGGGWVGVAVFGMGVGKPLSPLAP